MVSIHMRYFRHQLFSKQCQLACLVYLPFELLIISLHVKVHILHWVHIPVNLIISLKVCPVSTNFFISVHDMFLQIQAIILLYDFCFIFCNNCNFSTASYHRFSILCRNNCCNNISVFIFYC